MKGLNKFVYFDWESFAQDKRFVVVGVKPWTEYETKNVLGTKFDLVIAMDKTDYDLPDGQSITNVYKPLSVKVNKIINLPLNVEVELINAEATVYGQYRNQLSIVAEDVRVIKR